MKRLSRALGFAISTVLLSACTTTPVIEYVYHGVPPHFTEISESPAPPSVVLYMNLTCERREELLAKYSRDLILENQMLRSTQRALRAWDTEQRSIWEKK